VFSCHKEVVVESVVVVTSAAVLCGYIVEFFKLSVPNAKPWMSVLVAIMSGVASAIILAIATGSDLGPSSVATRIIEGIAAAATAAGLTRTVAKAEQVKIDAMHEIDEGEDTH
jgi:ABC-type uncharacterized transport system permease subunit